MNVAYLLREPSLGTETRTDLLVVQAQSGDHRAFEELYRLHVGRVYAVCLRILADAGRASELTQDVFVRVWDMIGTFRARVPSVHGSIGWR